MVEKISRDICIIKYRNLPLCEYDKTIDDDILYHPKTYSSYWLKLAEESNSNLSKEIVSLIKKLNINQLIFFSEMNKPWISKFTESRKDLKKIINAVEYFKSHKIEKKFNGGVKVEINGLYEFLQNFITITESDSSFHDFNFIDENENFIFYIHYSGELKLETLNEISNINFQKSINETQFTIQN
ncbi:hypothetical protein OBJ95_08330 [Empedobacter falsenii]